MSPRQGEAPERQGSGAVLRSAGKTAESVQNFASSMT